MPDTTVKYFDSTMSGAPALSGTAGTLISVLDACLINGMGSVTLNSLVVADNVATGTVSAGHNLALIGSAVGPVIRIAGATPSSLNGDWRLASVPGSTTFTFATTGISDQTGTGTITAVRAPLGFSAAFSGTNKTAYRADDVTSSRLYLRVDDTGTTSARVRGYETMSNVDTGTGPFPTDTQYSGGLYWGKSSAASGTARAWRLIGDAQGFVFFVNQDGSNNWINGLWIDIPSEKTADAYRTLLIGGATTTVANMGGLYAINSSTGHYMARSYKEIGTSVAVTKDTHRLMLSGLGYSGAGSAYPSPVGNQFYAAGIDVWESGPVLRGVLPGIYCPLHPATSLTDGAILPSVTGLAGRSLLAQRMVYGGSNFACAIDLTGPWR